ncbi:MAG: GNAT family N-acetyltransferase [Chloroflexota bacterium]
MKLRRYQRIEDFYRRAERFLLLNEAEHSLILGLCTSARGQPAKFEQQPYLAAVEQDGAVVAAALMTPPLNLIISHLTTAQALPLIAQDVHRRHPTLPGVLAPSAAAEQFGRCWQALSGQPYHLRTAERIYQLDAVTPAPGVPGALRRAGDADRDLLVAWAVAFYAETDHQSDPQRALTLAERNVAARLHADAGGYYLWIDGGPVSLAGCTGPTPHGIRIGPVYTPPERRGHGYASAAVAALSQSLLDRGYRHCFLYTDLSNPTSNKIYQAIGYRPVCDVDEYVFGAAE